MSTETESHSELPSIPHSVVWSMGHAFVLEGARWVGMDDRRRPLHLTNKDLERRGWTRRRAS